MICERKRLKIGGCCNENNFVSMFSVALISGFGLLNVFPSSNHVSRNFFQAVKTFFTKQNCVVFIVFLKI